MKELLHGAVLGHPIGHSKSPALHNAAYQVLGAHFSYTALDIQIPELAELLDRVRAEGNWYGLSVTMPLKNAAVALVDELGTVAAALGSVNTIVCSPSPDGGTHLLGENTDVAGIVNALRHAGARKKPRAAILGGGGTAVAAMAALAQLDASEVVVFVRNPAKSNDVLRVAEQLKVTSSVEVFVAASTALAGFDVVISTLPPRGADALAETFAASGRELGGAVLLDVAYDPWPSALAVAWQECGGVVVAGIEMLLYQGIEQVKLFAQAGGHGATATEKLGDVINVMCDALGISRRNPHEQNMAG